jgi:hypothetical protein
MVSLYWLKHIAQKGVTLERERKVLELLKLDTNSVPEILVGFEYYSYFYDDIVTCMDRKLFCPKYTTELPLELKNDFMVLFADRFIEFVLNFFKRDCIATSSYKVEHRGIKIIKCKNRNNKYISLTTIKIGTLERDRKANFIESAYKNIADLRGSLIFKDLNFYKKLAKELFLISNMTTIV